MTIPKAIRYWRYKSVVTDVYKSTRFNTVGTDDGFFSSHTRVERKICKEFKDWLKDIKKRNKDIHFDTNKIVFELEDGNYIGWYDGMLMWGKGRRGDSYVKPIDLK